ncbi:hypothetical protein BN3087_910006 [Sulfurovum sp. enrichment culture clone C5]|uniref:Uncharacterized protein n=1 Tax=Sulfurovum sp. enrichment culture clone C5 TaxID=497650 RepID=A0A0S4XQU1_9BACT|nr:hypothetical protein BN3087_910006 [Sulfurovum sp. enrichment culture clone C5]
MVLENTMKKIVLILVFMLSNGYSKSLECTKQQFMLNILSLEKAEWRPTGSLNEIKNSPIQIFMANKGNIAISLYGQGGDANDFFLGITSELDVPEVRVNGYFSFPLNNIKTSSIDKNFNEIYADKIAILRPYKNDCNLEYMTFEFVLDNSGKKTKKVLLKRVK